jgi:hypothetical protein
MLHHLRSLELATHDALARHLLRATHARLAGYHRPTHLPPGDSATQYRAQARSLLSNVRRSSSCSLLLLLLVLAILLLLLLLLVLVLLLLLLLLVLLVVELLLMDEDRVRGELLRIHSHLALVHIRLIAHVHLVISDGHHNNTINQRRRAHSKSFLTSIPAFGLPAIWPMPGAMWGVLKARLPCCCMP